MKYLLKKYMEHISDIEGMDYLSDSKLQISSVKFTDSELEKLIEISIEIINEANS